VAGATEREEVVLGMVGVEGRVAMEVQQMKR
jgi:hypothetical protein